MSDSVLVLNAGSSSIKFGLFDIAPSEPELQCKGLLDEQEKVPRIVVSDASGRQLFEKRRASGTLEDNGLFGDIFAWIEDYLDGGRLAAVGHRIVHGGREFYGPVVIAGQTLAALEALTPLAPLHQPRCLAPVRAVQSLQPELTQIACFDTAFHHGLAPPVSRFAIRQWREPLCLAKGRQRRHHDGIDPTRWSRDGDTLWNDRPRRAALSHAGRENVGR